MQELLEDLDAVIRQLETEGHTAEAEALNRAFMRMAAAVETAKESAPAA